MWRNCWRVTWRVWKTFFETSPITASIYKVHKTAVRDQYFSSRKIFGLALKGKVHRRSVFWFPPPVPPPHTQVWDLGVDVCAYQRERLLDISTCTRELGGASLIYRICGIFGIPWCGVMVTRQRGDRGYNYSGVYWRIFTEICRVSCGRRYELCEGWTCRGVIVHLLWDISENL